MNEKLFGLANGIFILTIIGALFWHSWAEKPILVWECLVVAFWLIAILISDYRYYKKMEIPRVIPHHHPPPLGEIVKLPTRDRFDWKEEGF